MLLAALGLYHRRYLPAGAMYSTGDLVINRSLILRSFAPFVAVVLAGVLAFGSSAGGSSPGGCSPR